MMTTSDSENGEFGIKTETFLSWLQGRPGVTISPKIRIADLRHLGVGRGVVAVEDIEDDEELFSITPKDVLSVENSSLSTSHPEICQQLDSWNSLILTMIYEDGQGKTSEWWPYLDILPTNFDTLMYWSHTELAEVQGSAVLEKIEKDSANQSFLQMLLPKVQQYSQLFGTHAAIFQKENATQEFLRLAHRMASLIMAYGFDLENEAASSVENEAASSEEDGEDDGEEKDRGDGPSVQEYVSRKGMVPLADMFNADGDLNNAHLLQSEVSMTMIALRPIKAGDQIFNDYGQLPRSDLLRRYGYITDRYKQWDVVEIDLGVISAIAAEHSQLGSEEIEQRLRLATEWEVLQDGYDLCRSTRVDRFDFDTDLILTVTALLMNAADYEKACATAQVPDEPPAHLRVSVYKGLKSIIARRSEEYHTTNAQDATLLADSTIHPRHRLAIEVRLGEKEILASAARETDRQLAKLIGSQQDTNNNNAKKRKL